MKTIMKKTLIASAVVFGLAGNGYADDALSQSSTALKAAISKLEAEVKRASELRQGEIGSVMKEKSSSAAVTALMTEAQVESEELAKQHIAALTKLADDIEEDIDIIDSKLTAAAAIKVKSPTTFPGACGNDKMTKDLKVFAGILEPSPGTRKMMFSMADEKATDGLKRIPLADQVGMIGSTSDDIVVSRTSKDRYVEVVVKDDTVVCISKEIDVKKFDEMKAKRKYAN